MTGYPDKQPTPPTNKKNGLKITIITIAAIVVLITLIGTAINVLPGLLNPDSDQSTDMVSVIVVSTGDSIDLKEGLDDASKTVAQIPTGTEVSAIKHDGEWWQVEYGDKRGWCRSKNLIDKADYINTPGIVASIAGSINLFSADSTSSTLIGKLGYFCEVTVVKQNGEWMYVISEHGMGWCVADAFVPSSATTNEEAIVTSSGSTLEIKDAAVTGTVLCEAPKGSFVNVITQVGTASLVSYSGKTGWCPSDSLTLRSSLGNGNYAIVTTDQYNLNIRETPSIDGRILYSIPKGELIPVYSKSANGWYFIKYKGVEGWCSGDKLTIIK